MSAVPSGSGGLPTRSEIEEWDTSDLANAATSWRAAATASENAFDELRQNISSPGGTTWEGNAKDAALDRATADCAVVGRQGAVLCEAAELAENGAYDIMAAQGKVLEAIATAESNSFRVGEDLSVTDTKRVDVFSMRQRQLAANEHAEDIRWTAQQLAQADKLVGDRLEAKAAELQGIRFEREDERDSSSGHIRLVDDQVKHGDERKGQQGEKSGAAPGQIGPFAVPKAVERAAKKPESKPAAAGDVGGDLGDVLGVNDRPTEGPRPKPTVASQISPEQVEQFKTEARKLLRQRGVPPDEIEQQVNAMVADARRMNALLADLPPYTPAEGSAPPKPSYSDGFGDAWRGAEDSVHDLVGYNGIENFKDAWKDLGSGLFETATDPAGAAARRIEGEIEAFRNNPEYWLGGKTFDAAATAATLPFGGEVAAARSALGDVVSPGVPHELVDSAAERINSHPPISVEHSVLGDHPAHNLGEMPLPVDVLPDSVPLPDTGPYHLPDPAQLTTPPDGATFWSGRNGDGIGIGPISAGGNGAADLIAGGNSATTLEGLLDANGIQPPKWSPADVYADNWWSAVSQIYAENASGEVHAVVGSNLRPGNVWENVELPRLMDNPSVTKIIVIDPETGIHTTVFQR
ncbi:hypothetical protein [Mycolicibacterium peregrinum]|uniref:Uncharacterized protein n=1 Tax=Mycolicibacterium peregrinum TaxID=43304 RepID=A0A1A0W814_MYCPR|nr:hypothetical protein [Mycolicibacterium peregrinum]OBB92289.1 hypothetical protein A5779_22265 [Mycolicibacterium peregrinum]